MKRTGTGLFPRWLGMVLAAIVGAGLIALAAQPVPARAGVPKKARWKSTAPSGEWRNAGAGFILDNNVLNTSAAGSQTIWGYSYRRWGVESTQPDTPGIKAYPCVKKFYNSHPKYSSLRYLRSSFKESIPSTGTLAADATYTIWLNDHQIEVMVWVDSRNRTPAGKPIGNILIYLQDYEVYQSGSTFTFVPTGPPGPPGKVHLLSALRWLVHHSAHRHRFLSRSDRLSEVDFGWEIASTSGTPQDFGLTGYAVSSGRYLPPKNPASVGVAFPFQRWVLIGGVIAVFVAVFLLAMTVLGRIARVGRARTLSGMFDKYGPRRRRPTPAQTEPESSGKVATAAVGAMNRLMTSGAQERLARRLDLAGVTRKPAEWTLLAACVGVVVAVMLSLVTSYFLLAVLAGAVIGWLVMRLSLSVRILRRRASFSDQLPDILQLIASTLQAGFSLPQALDAVVREQSQPAAGEFSRAVAETRLGANLEDALDAVATRMDSDDLRWTVMAMRIQQGVGGNLAEVLLTIAGTIRERSSLRRQVRALSAEGRLSAYILVTMPLVVAAWLFISSATYMRPLYTTTFGEVMLVIATGLIVIGALWMHRVIKVEI